jgi:cbb3-type cytochrome oxidase maturation protein
MAVMFVLLPVALAFAAAALAVFLWAVRTGQFDDLDTPPVRILLDEEAPGASRPAPPTANAPAGDSVYR